MPEADTENVAYGDDAGSGDEGSDDDDCFESYTESPEGSQGTFW